MPLAAPGVRERRLGRQIDVAELGVGRHRSPNAGVADHFGRTVEPRLVARLAPYGNRVERPQQLAGMDVEAAHVALQVRLRRRPHADLVRGTDDDDVADDGRRRAVADARLVVDLTAHADHEIDDAVLAEARHRSAGVGIERGEKEPRRHREQPLVACAVGPVRGAAARGFARRARVALLAVVRPPVPQQLAALRVDRNDVARGAGLRVEDTVDHQRRRLVARFGARAVVAGVEPPRDFELARITRIDLIERRIPLRGEIAAVEPPFDVARRGIGRRRANGRRRSGRRLRGRAALRGRRACDQETGGEQRQYDAWRIRHNSPPVFSCRATLHRAVAPPRRPRRSV